MPIQSLVYYKLNVIKTLMSFVNIKIESFEILGKDIEKKLQYCLTKIEGLINEIKRENNN